MAESTIWWLLAGVAIGLELVTGTFYLLMVGIGLAAGAIAGQGSAPAHAHGLIDTLLAQLEANLFGE